MIDLDSWFCLTAFQELTIFHCMVLKCQDLCLYKNLTSTQHYFCQVPHCGRLSQIQEKLFDVDLPLEYMTHRVKIVWLWMRGWCQYNHRHFRSPWRRTRAQYPPYVQLQNLWCLWQWLLRQSNEMHKPCWCMVLSRDWLPDLQGQFQGNTSDAGVFPSFNKYFVINAFKLVWSAPNRVELNMLGNGSCDLGFLYHGCTSLMLGQYNKVVIKDINLTGTNSLSVIGKRQKK